MTSTNRWTKVAATAGAGGVFLAAIAVQWAALAQTWGAAYGAPGAAVAVVVCVLALVRHRERTRTAVAGLLTAAVAVLVGPLFDVELPAEPGPATTLGLAVLIGSAVRALPAVRAGAVAGGGLLLIAGQFAARPASAVVVLAVVGWLVALAVGGALRMQDARARAAVERVRRGERLELARELHDVVAHHLTGMLIQAQAAQVVARRSPEQVAQSLAEIEAAGSEAMVAMRRVVGLLRHADHDSDSGADTDTGADIDIDHTDDGAPASPGPEQLGTLVERFGRQGPSTRLTVPDDASHWPPEVTSTVYRIVQEALTNVLRHARHARSVEVTVVRAAGVVTVEVVDDAPHPGRPPHRGGYGVIGMRERVETLGGSLHAGPRPGAGWSVRAALPVPARGPG
ncbi:sensor histidine kinase [Streptomyces sp. NPDC059578]|uniref:sensor histidine kinase n=1 Tax=Streptomyces sp. NPDC059578 TaxID=3346874 RepID=UPI00369AB924